MLSFLRKLRKSLIDAGSIRKYLLYAVGEIVLVMIGILLALQVNNTNQERALRKQEKLLLAEIHEEFKYNLREFKDNIERYDFTRSNLRRITDFFPIDLNHVDVDSLAALMETTHFVGNYDYSKISVEKIKSTGSFDIISNEELNNLLFKWEVLLADYVEIESQVLQYHEDRYSPILTDHIPRPYKKGLRDPRINPNFLGSIPFEGIIKKRHWTINNMFRLVEVKEDDLSIVKVMERIVELSAS
jgi:hypothetical protein